MKHGWTRIAIPIGLLVLALMIAPFLVQGDERTEQQLDQNREAIAQMTEAERERLNYNFNDFQQMTPEQQQVIRDLHQRIETDLRHGKGELSQVLDVYARWLQTVEPYERVQLLQTTDPDQRIALIRDILRKQREKVAERATHRGSSHDDRQKFHNGMEQFRHPITGQDLKRVMAAIEEFASDKLDDDEKKDLAGRSGLNRYVQLLSVLREQDINRMPLKDAPPEEFTQVVQNFDNYVEDSWLRDFISSEEDLENKVRRFTWQLHYSLNFDLAMQLHKAKRPVSQEQLEEYFHESLTEQEQNELISLEAQDFVSDLRNQYLNQQLGDLPDAKQISEIFTGEEHPFRGWRGGDDRRRNREDWDRGDRNDDERRWEGRPEDRRPDGRREPGLNRGDDDRDDGRGRGRGAPPFDRPVPPGMAPPRPDQFGPPGRDMRGGGLQGGPGGRPPFRGQPPSPESRPPFSPDNGNGPPPPAPNTP